MSSPPSLDSLPNELLSSILSQLPTSALLPLITINHRIYSTALHLLTQRLYRATSQPDRRVMLECYHPTEKLYTPYLYCDYLYCDPFPESEAASSSNVGTASANEGDTSRGSYHRRGLSGVYSHFQPIEHDEARPRRGSRSWWRPNGSSGSSLPSPMSPTPTAANSTNESHEPPPPPSACPSLDIFLDEDESFSQLVCVTNLVRLGARPGLFRSHVNVSEAVVRVGRDWLSRRTGGNNANDHNDNDHHHDNDNDDNDDNDDEILWADPSRAIGLRFRVTEKDLRSERPVLVASDEQLPVAYRLEFDELLIRSTTLLVMAERSEVEEVSAEGKAIVLASF